MRNHETLNITINGRSVTLGAPGLSVLCAAAERVQDSKTQRFAEAVESCGSLAGEARVAALSCALERHQAIVTDCEVASWLDSPEGDAFLFWHAARTVSPFMSEAEARELYESLNADQIPAIAEFFAAHLGVNLKKPGSPQGDLEKNSGQVLLESKECR